MTDLTPEQLELLNSSCSQCYKKGCSVVEATVRKLIRTAEQDAREKAVKGAATIICQRYPQLDKDAVAYHLTPLLGGKE